MRRHRTQRRADLLADGSVLIKPGRGVDIDRRRGMRERREAKADEEYEAKHALIVHLKHLMAGTTGVDMAYVKSLTTALSVLFIVSCSAAPPPPPPATTVFDPLTQPLNRARDAQKVIDERAAKTRDAIDNPERGEISH